MDSWIREENNNVAWQTKNTRVNHFWKIWGKQEVCCGMKHEEYNFLMKHGFSPTEAFGDMLMGAAVGVAEAARATISLMQD